MTRQQFNELRAMIVIVGVIAMLAFVSSVALYHDAYEALERIETNQEADAYFRGRQLDRIEEKLDHIDGHFQGGSSSGHPELDPGGVDPTPVEGITGWTRS